EWASWDRQPALGFEGSEWIWFPEGNPAQDAPVGKRSFRRTFDLPAGKAIQGARLRVSADDRFTARLNGEVVGSGTSWGAPQQFNDLAPRLKAGVNVLAIEGENMPAPGANPAGLIAAFEVDFADGTSMKIVSDVTWRTSQTESLGWDSAGFDGAGWSAAKVIGHYGDAPWGQFDAASANSDAYSPQSTGIPGGVRIIYVPESKPVTVHNLEGSMTASYFDPVTGARTPIGPIHPDTAGSWLCPPPAGNDHDWVIVLEGKGT
nr:alpha-L-rhamnosidase [Armatimonadota bacterium]